MPRLVISVAVFDCPWPRVAEAWIFWKFIATVSVPVSASAAASASALVSASSLVSVFSSAPAASCASATYDASVLSSDSFASRNYSRSSSVNILQRASFGSGCSGSS